MHLTSALDSQLKSGKLPVCTIIYTEICWNESQKSASK